MAGRDRGTVVRTSAKRRPVPRAHPALRDYRRLGPFFPVKSERAKALGASTETLRTWEQRPPSRLRSGLVENIRLVLEVCLELEPLMDKRSDVGRWMLSPQPQLRGRTPVSLLHADGKDAIERLLGLAVEQIPAAVVPEDEIPGWT